MPNLWQRTLRNPQNATDTCALTRSRRKETRLLSASLFPFFIDAFYIDTHEVTVGEWKAFIEATGYQPTRNRGEKDQLFWITDDPPVTMISHPDAEVYAAWAGKRLPTADEWEKAARGGLVGTAYPWGNEPHNETRGNFPKGTTVGAVPVPVGSYDPNGYGLYDVVGNVAEWGADTVRDCEIEQQTGREICYIGVRGGSYVFGFPTVYYTDWVHNVRD